MKIVRTSSETRLISKNIIQSNNNRVKDSNMLPLRKRLQKNGRLEHQT